MGFTWGVGTPTGESTPRSGTYIVELPGKLKIQSVVPVCLINLSVTHQCLKLESATLQVPRGYITSGVSLVGS